MSTLLVILVTLIANISNNLHNYITENVLVSIHSLLLTYVFILEASIINRYAEIIKHVCNKYDLSFHITNKALFSEIP